MPSNVIVSRRDLKQLLDYAQEERDMDYESNYSHLTERVEPAEVRKHIEKFDKLAKRLNRCIEHRQAAHQERIAELEQRIANAEFNAPRGLCVIHHWGAPPGQDELPCPYCIGLRRGR